MITYTRKYQKEYTGFLIYKIQNPNGEYYIGATTNIKRRIEAYRSAGLSIKNQKLLRLSLNKWSFSEHTLTILYTHEGAFTMNDIKEAEWKYIKEAFKADGNKLLNIVIKGEPRRSAEEVLRHREGLNKK